MSDANRRWIEEVAYRDDSLLYARVGLARRDPRGAWRARPTVTNGAGELVGRGAPDSGGARATIAVGTPGGRRELAFAPNADLYAVALAFAREHGLERGAGCDGDAACVAAALAAEMAREVDAARADAELATSIR